MSQQPKRPASLSSLADFASPKGMATASPDVVADVKPAPASPSLAVVKAAPRPTPLPVRPVSPAPTQQYGEAPKGRVQLGIRLDVDRHEQLRLIAFQRRVKIQTIVEDLIDQFLAGAGEG